MSLKYLPCEQGGRQMLRSLVTMAICWVGGASFDPLSSSSGMACRPGGAQWFQIRREGLAGKPACRPTSQTSARTKLWKSLAHKYVPCRGWSRAETPAAVKFPSERPTSQEGGDPHLRSLLCAFLWGKGAGALHCNLGPN